MDNRTVDGRFTDSRADLDTQARHGIGGAHSKGQADLTALLPDPVLNQATDYAPPSGYYPTSGTSTTTVEFIGLIIFGLLVWAGWTWVYKPFQAWREHTARKEAALAQYEALHPDLKGSPRAAAYKAADLRWPSMNEQFFFAGTRSLPYEPMKAVEKLGGVKGVLAAHARRPLATTEDLLAYTLASGNVQALAAEGPAAVAIAYAAKEARLAAAVLPANRSYYGATFEIDRCIVAVNADLAAALAGGPSAAFQKAADKAPSCVTPETEARYRASSTSDKSTQDSYLASRKYEMTRPAKALEAYRSAGGR